MNTSNIKALSIAILGCGRIGQVHADTVTHLPEANLTAVADPYMANAQLVANRYGCAIADVESIMQSSEIDAVIVCTPTDTHADLIEQAAKAGKAIFCEKPIDLDINRVIECLSVVKDTQATLMVGFNRRFDPNFIALKQQLSSGSIGNIETLAITSRDPGLPPYGYIEKSGGIFRDMTIHDFDMARFLLDEEFTTVFAHGAILIDPKIAQYDDFDTATVLLTTASGKQCTIVNSRRASYGYDQRIEVHGSIGMISAQNIHENTVELATEAGYTRAPLQHFFMTRYNTAYRAEITAFINNTSQNTSPSPSGSDGLHVLYLANAALESAKTGKLMTLS